MQNTELFKKLSEPFREEDIDWRVARAGLKRDGKVWAYVLAYIDARAVMDRLDQVLGPENWQDKYRKEGEAFICSLGIRVDGEWIWKEDGADETDIEAIKGGVSGSFKRVAVKFGIGRYLYDLKESFAGIVEKGTPNSRHGRTKEGQEFSWIPPKLPQWALPPESKTNEDARRKTIESVAKLKEDQMGSHRSINVRPVELKDIDKVIMEIQGAQTLDELKEFWQQGAELLKQLPESEHARIIKYKDERKKELTDKALKPLGQ